MKRAALFGLLLCLSLGLAVAGCKKKEEKKKETKDRKQAVEKKAPEKKAETPEPLVTPDEPAEVPAVAPAPEGPAEPEEKKPDPAAEVKPEPEAKPDTVADPVVKEEEAPAVAAEPPVEEGAQPPPEEGAESPDSPDVVAGEVAGEVVQDELPEGQFGRKFKLDAVMMLNDVVKNPDHYAEFESVKLRGEVLVIKGNLVLLGLRVSEGLFAFMARVEDPSLEKMYKGQWVVLEGRIVGEGWSPDGLGSIKMDEGQELKASYEHVLAVEAGKLE